LTGNAQSLHYFSYNGTLLNKYFLHHLCTKATAYPLKRTIRIAYCFATIRSMNTLSHHFLLTSLTRWLLATAIIVLAFEPVRWLVATWQDPSYSSSGFYFFAVCAALFCWSAGSKRYTSKPVQHRYALALLGGTALIRLAGQVFAINVIGALALIIDVYAIAYLSALHLRKRAIAPFWLAACFAFSLPLERIIQRSIGYGLQHLSADTSCVILGSFFDSVSCHGVRILLAGQDVLVDLPCSGARALVLLLFLFCVTAAICRTSLKGNLFGMALVLASSLLTNALRITFLAVGIAFPQDGIDVMAQPWHDIIGLTALAQGCIPIYFWGRWNYCRPKAQHSRLDQLRWLRPRFMATIITHHRSNPLLFRYWQALDFYC
jgi:exosortase/archaeosortase family protein